MLSLLLFVCCKPTGTTNNVENNDSLKLGKSVDITGKIKNAAFGKFVEKLTVLHLPIDLKARVNWGFEHKNAVMIDTSDVIGFVCAGKDENDCWYYNDGSVHYYFYGKIVSENFISLIFYMPYNAGHKYFVNNYSYDGLLVSSTILSAIEGDKYEQDASINDQMELSITKLNLGEVYNMSNDRTEVDAYTEEKKYKILPDGKIDSVSNTKGATKRYLFLDNKYEPI